MSTLTELSKLTKQVGGNMNVNANANSRSNSNSGSISAPTTVNTRNELSALYSDIRKPNNSFSQNSQNSQNNNNDAASSGRNSQVDELDAKFRKYSLQSMQASNKIVSIVRYLASPLRLVIKANANFKASMDERVAYVMNIKISDDVKYDFVSNWTAEDTFGLMVLVKMLRFVDNVYPTIQDMTSYMKTFKPSFDLAAPGNLENIRIAFYLHDVVMNFPNQNMIHEIFKNQGQWIKESLDEDGLGEFIQDVEQDFRGKIAQELNLAAEAIVQKRVTMKTLDGVVNNWQPKDLIQNLYVLFQSNPATASMAQQMEAWKTNDVDVVQTFKAASGGAKKRKQMKRK
jgi:cell division protein ZapA (FtsZ GTPase activity inhibitor)